MPFISLAHISLLPLSPPDMVEISAQAGFDAVGIRLEPAVPGEQRFPMQADTPMLRETKARLAATGLKVFDIEVFRLSSGMSFGRHRAAFDICAELGATELLITCDIQDESEAVDRMAEACTVAAEYGLAINLEFMPWQAVNDLNAATKIMKGAGKKNAAILVDTLHVHRSDVSLEQLAAIDRGSIRYIQLCDAPAPPPDFETMLFQARNERLMPGEGVIPLTSYLEVLPKDLPVSAEIPMRRRMKEIGPLALARQAMETTLAVLSAAGWHDLR